MSRQTSIIPQKLRIYAFLIAVMLILSALLGACGDNGASDDVSESNTSEYTLERGENEKQITFYFNRSGGYTNCDIWLWYDNVAGRGYLFHECEYGAKVVVNVPSSVSTVGFIVRTDCSEPGGTSWGSATKDATESDRFADLTGDETVYYLKSGDALLYTSDDGGKTLSAMKKILLGDLADTTTVKFSLNDSMKIEKDDVRIKDKNGNLIGIESVDSPGGRYGTITVSAPLDITSSYTLEIKDMDAVTILPCSYFSSAAFDDEYGYDGELGVILGEGTTTFKLWAPTASEVVLNLFDNGSTGTAYEQISLSKGEKGVWTYTASSRLDGKYYTYSVTTAAGKQEAVDPYARSAGINGKRGMIIDLDSTDPDGWSDDTTVTTTENYTDAVIWEIHIRDFSNTISSSAYPGKYLAFTESGLTNEAGVPVGLDYLKELGITHVHLMPTYDYASVDESKSTGYNWGYDPQNYNVPEGSYSTDPSDGAVRVNEFKRMVQALHDAGIGVVMDVVYNHTYDGNSNLNKIVPYYYYRYNADGTNSNGSGCGNETASDHAMFCKYMIDSVLYWMDEYHIDGFRFDLMGLHDVETMKAIEKAVHAVNPNALIYGEGWTGGTSALSSSQLSNLANIKSVNADSNVNGVAMFNDVLRDGIKGSTDGKDTGFATGAKSALINRIKFGVIGGVNNFAFSGFSSSWTTYSPTNMINYASAHDNLALWDKICYAYGEDASTLDARLKRNALSGAIVMTSLGVPFMQGGEEMLRAKKNADGSYNHNSYNSPDSVNNLKWELLSETSEQYAMFKYYKGLIAFRKASSALRSPTAFDENGSCICKIVKEEGTLLAFTVQNDEETLLVVYNAGESAVKLTLPDGSWDLYINGESAGTAVLEAGIGGTVDIDAISCYVYKLN